MTKRYHQLGHEGVTSAVDKLQQEVGGWRREAPPQTCAGAPAAGAGGQGSAWAVFSLQFHCCGSNNSQDWRDSEWIRSGEAGGRVVPDSCCKTVVAGCGQRDHASNIYKVEVGRRGPAETPRALVPGMPGAGVARHPRGLPSAHTPCPAPAGRLHHQAGDLHPGAPEDHRGRGPRHCLRAGAGTAGRAGGCWDARCWRPRLLMLAPCSGVRHDLHVLPVQEPEAGALLTLPAGRPSVCAAASRVR